MSTKAKTAAIKDDQLNLATYQKAVKRVAYERTFENLIASNG